MYCHRSYNNTYIYISSSLIAFEILESGTEFVKVLSQCLPPLTCILILRKIIYQCYNHQPVLHEATNITGVLGRVAKSQYLPSIVLLMIFISFTENFDETNRLETWDRMRIICTQPFRKDKPFGVSMLKLRAETDLDAINNNSVSVAERVCVSH